MADLGDVETLLATMAFNAVYPTGGSNPSVTGHGVVVGPGWPQPGSLDPLITGGGANVSIFAIPGGSPAVFQVLDQYYTIVPAVFGMVPSISQTNASSTVTVTGTPGIGEYLSIITDNKFAFSRGSVASPATVASILSQLATDASVDYAGVVATASTISLPTTRIVVHVGAPATIGKVTHREKQQFFITVWAPNPTDRDKLAAAVDVALKSVNHLTMPDTSQAILVYSHANQIDEKSTVSIYRRDLVYSVEYATLALFTAWVVTSFNPTLDGGPGQPGDNILTQAIG